MTSSRGALGRAGAESPDRGENWCRCGSKLTRDKARQPRTHVLPLAEFRWLVCRREVRRPRRFGSPPVPGGAGALQQSVQRVSEPDMCGMMPIDPTWGRSKMALTPATSRTPPAPTSNPTRSRCGGKSYLRRATARELDHPTQSRLSATDTCSCTEGRATCHASEFRKLGADDGNPITERVRPLVYERAGPPTPAGQHQECTLRARVARAAGQLTGCVRHTLHLGLTGWASQ